MFTRKDFEAGRVPPPEATPAGPTPEPGPAAAAPAPADPEAAAPAPVAPAPAVPAAAGGPCRVAFVSTMCLLDPVSGAAISARHILAALAAAGFAVRVFTASLFDANTEVPFGPILGAAAEPEEARGKLLRIEREGLEHFILLTASSRGPNMTQPEQSRMAEKWRAQLEEFRPDIVMTYGTSRLARQMQADARAAGAQLVFYLGNAEIAEPELVKPGDRVVCCSDYLARHYRETLGVEAQVIHPIIEPGRFVEPGAPAIAGNPGMRRLGLVSFVNPLPHKGLTLFARLAQRAVRELPDMRFAVVEGRMTRDLLRRYKLDLPAWRNVWWLPTQADLSALYARSAMLLVPSFWREGFGRSVVEAQLSGLPVLASDRGGLGEALNGGGFVLPVPEACAENHYAFPDPGTVEQWWEVMARLWNDEGFYAETCARAREASAHYNPERTRAVAVGHFSAIAAARAAAPAG